MPCSLESFFHATASDATNPSFDDNVAWYLEVDSDGTSDRNNRTHNACLVSSLTASTQQASLCWHLFTSLTVKHFRHTLNGDAAQAAQALVYFGCVFFLSTSCQTAECQTTLCTEPKRAESCSILGRRERGKHNPRLTRPRLHSSTWRGPSTRRGRRRVGLRT